MVTYVAALDVPRHGVEFVARLLAAHCRRIGTPRRSRALGPFRQAVLMLRWFRERGCVHCLAYDAGVSQASGYRYLYEAIDILAAQVASSPVPAPCAGPWPSITRRRRHHSQVTASTDSKGGLK